LTDQLFSTTDIDNNLKSLTFRALIFSVGSQAIMVILKLVSTIVLVRLLAPSDFGILLMVSSVIGLLLVFKDLGLSLGTVQKKEITHEEISFVFWVNVIVGIILCFIGIACAPLLGLFYDKTSVILVTIVLSFAFIPNGLAAQHQALLKRRMRFFSLALADLLSQLCGMGVGIAAAFKGVGYWALVYMQLTQAFVYMIVVWIYTRWIPGFPRRTPGTHSILSFGGYLSLFGGVNYLLRNIDNVLIGRVWGEAALGFYGKAYELLMLPLYSIATPLSNVFIPVLSRLQHDPFRYRAYYNQFLSSLFLLSMPIVMLCNVHAKEMIEIVLGPQWCEASTIFYYLSFGSVAQVVCTTSGWLYVSLGRTRELFKYGSIGAVLFIFAFFVGVQYGARGVAIAYSAAMIIWLVPCMVFATRNTVVSLRIIWLEFSIHLLGMAVGGGVSYLVRLHLFEAEPSCVALMFAVIAGLLCYAAVVVVMFGRWRMVKLVLEHVSEKRETTEAAA